MPYRIVEGKIPEIEYSRWDAPREAIVCPVYIDSDSCGNYPLGTVEYGNTFRSRSVIKAYIPPYMGEDELNRLKTLYKFVFGSIASSHDLKSISFPLLGAGSPAGYPEEAAQRIAENAVRQAQKDNADLELILFVPDRREIQIDKETKNGLEEFLERLRLEEGISAPKSARPVFSKAATTTSSAERKERDEVSQPNPEKTETPDAAKKQREEFFTTLNPILESLYSQREDKDSTEPLPRDDAVWAAAPELNEDDTEEIELTLDESFSQMVMRKIDEKGFRKDSDCYCRANIDRRLFSKLRCDATYHPKKTTALALAVALELPLDETKELLLKAGYSLSHSILLDVIVEYCITKKNYDIFRINELLFQYDQPLLGG